MRLPRREFIRCCLGATPTLACLQAGNSFPAVPASPRPVPGPLTAVRTHRGKPTFFVDDQPYTKPVFETYVPETKFFRQFAEAGTDVFCFATNLGAGFAAPVWLGPDEFDFRQLDMLAHRVLEANPQGLILPRIYLTTPAWWTAANLAECQVLANGSQRYSPGRGHGRDGQAFPSLASARWRTDTAAALQRVIEHLQAADYGDRLFGYAVTGLMSEEWYHWSIHTEELSDYSSHAVAAFREWLRRKYRDRDALRQAWNVPGVEFETAEVPSQVARQAGRNERTFRDPATEMQVVDWYLFYNDLVPDAMDSFLHAAKEASGYRKVVGAFYCYMFEFGGDPEFGHNALGRLLRSPFLDFALVTASYHDRVLGRGADYARAPLTSVALHNKLWYHDNDTVSFRYDAINQAQPDRATVERYRRELGVTDSPQETIWQYQRGAGFVLGHGIYQSFFDLHGGYFDDPQLLAEVQRLNGLFVQSARHDRSSVAEILVVSDETSCSYATFESGFLQQTLQPLQTQLAKLGAPHDSILVDDLAIADLTRYKLVIFLDCFHLTDEQRERIRRTVLNGGRSVVWTYAPGLFNGSATSVAAMQALTGFSLVPSAQPDRRRLRIELTPDGEHWWQTLGGRSLPGRIGHEHVWGQTLEVQDLHAVALGRLESRPEIALAMKPMENWTAFYTLNPVLPAAFIRVLARHAGVHLYNDRDDTLYVSRSYLTVNADGAGERALHFPREVDVFDPFSGDRLARRVQAWSHTFQDKESLIVRYEAS